MKSFNFQTVLETPEFIRCSERSMSESAIEEFIEFIAKHPTKGDLISGTGGARKIRWTDGSSKGKRSGVRVIYYYYDQGHPIFLFTVYGKNVKDNITQDEKKALKRVIKQLIEHYRGN